MRRQRTKAANITRAHRNRTSRSRLNQMLTHLIVMTMAPMTWGQEAEGDPPESAPGDDDIVAAPDGNSLLRPDDRPVPQLSRGW